jgi:hypothetical protein
MKKQRDRQSKRYTQKGTLITEGREQKIETERENKRRKEEKYNYN